MMDENAKKNQREIAKDKIQIILSSIAVAVLVIMELYIMINFKSNFIAMAVGVLIMIVALFFLISALLDINLKQKDIEREKYEDIYNAQKASYLVIKKSFEEMEQRLSVIEQNSALPAEDIINAQKAVAKVTISRSKENTDALMNSNDELINQLVNIQEKIDSNNSAILEKQQTLLKENNYDLQQKISELTLQISNIQGRMESGIPVMAATAASTLVPEVAEPIAKAEPDMEESVQEEIPMDIEVPVVEPAVEEVVAEDLGIDLEAPIEEVATEDLGIDLEAPVEEAATENLGIDLEAPIEEAATEDLGIDLETPVEEEVTDDLGIDLEPLAAEEEISLEPISEVTEDSVDLDALLTEVGGDENPLDEAPAEEDVTEEEPVEADENIVDETIELEATSAPQLEPEEVVEIATEAPAVEEISAGESGDLDALLNEIGETVPEPEPEPKEEEKPEAAPATDEIVIPDVGIDLSDPNKVLSPEEIEKLFANI